MSQATHNTARLYGTLLSMLPADGGVRAKLRLERCVPIAGQLSLREPALGGQVEIELRGVRSSALMPGLRLVVAAQQLRPGLIYGFLLY